MKLYTLEEIKETLKSIDCEEVINVFIENADPIELPSDEEIGEQTKEITSFTSGTAKTIVESYYYSGAKWMKEQILNQNK